MIGAPLLATPFDQAQTLGGDGTRRADRGGAEPRADCIDRLLSGLPLALVRQLRLPAGLQQLVHRELLGHRAEVRTAHSEQAHAGAGIDGQQQWVDRFDDRVSGVDRTRQRDRAGDGLEPVEPHLQGESARRGAVRSQTAGNCVRQTHQLPVQLLMGVEIAREGFLMTDRLHPPIDLYRTVIERPGQPVQVLRVVELLEQNFGRKAERDLLPMQPGDVPATFADISELSRATGFKPDTSIEVGVAAFVDWYKAYRNV